MADYKPQELDKKWQAHWTSSRAFEVAADPSRPKYYCLEMFAYPSGHAHVGHVRNYFLAASDCRIIKCRHNIRINAARNIIENARFENVNAGEHQWILDFRFWILN